MKIQDIIWLIIQFLNFPPDYKRIMETTHP